MATFNMAQVMGRLGGDPEVRATQKGTKQTRFRVATNWTTKDGKEETIWHTITCYKKLADVAAKYLHKGSKVFVVGRMNNFKWVAKDGTDRFGNEIIADNIQFLDQAPKSAAATTNAAVAAASTQSQVPAATAGDVPNFAEPPPVDDDFYPWPVGEV